MAGFGSGAVRVALAAASVAWVAGFAPAGPGAGASPAEPVDGEIQRVSVGPGGVEANEASGSASPSRDGRFVAFASRASNLVAGDTNGEVDVFVRDRVKNVTRRVSVGPRGAQANEKSELPVISANGRWVVFRSRASNLAARDSNHQWDIFARSLTANVTVLISVSRNGRRGGNGLSGGGYSSISADGRYVAFTSNASNLVAGVDGGLFVRDRVAKVTRRVPGGGIQGGGSGGSLSADGRYIAYPSTRSLVPGDTNGATDVYVRDLVARVSRRISVGLGGAQANGEIFENLDSNPISGDGRYVAFASNASNLVEGDTNGTWDGFLRDRVAKRTERVSVGTGSAQLAEGGSVEAISADGQLVTFWSGGDLFVRDRAADVTRLISFVGVDGAPPDHGVSFVTMSSNARHLGFSSYSTNLVAGDTNDQTDVFVRDLSD